MSRVLGPLRSRAPYAFMVVGVAWIAVAVSVRSLLVLWPVVALLGAGVLLKIKPSDRFTWAWSRSSAVLGLLLSAWRAYQSIPFIGGSFTTIASISLGAFAAFGVVHFLLLYLGNEPTAEAI